MAVDITPTILDAILRRNYQIAGEGIPASLVAKYQDPLFKMLLPNGQMQGLGLGGKLQEILPFRVNAAMNASADPAVAFANANSDEYEEADVPVLPLWSAAHIQQHALQALANNSYLTSAEQLEKVWTERVLTSAINAKGSWFRTMNTWLWGYRHGGIAEISGVAANVITLTNRFRTHRFHPGMILNVTNGAVTSLDNAGALRVGQMTVTDVNPPAGTITVDAIVAGTAANDVIIPPGNRNKAWSGIWSWILWDANDARTFYGWDQTTRTDTRAGVRVPVPAASSMFDMFLAGMKTIKEYGMTPTHVFCGLDTYETFQAELPSLIQLTREQPGMSQAEMRQDANAQLGEKRIHLMLPGIGNLLLEPSREFEPVGVAPTNKAFWFTRMDSWRTRGAFAPNWIPKGNDGSPWRYIDGSGKYSAEYEGTGNLQCLDFSENLIVGDEAVVIN